LCCLTHEFETYKSLKKDMPKIGTIIEFEGERYKVIKVNILKSTVSASSSSDPATVRELLRDEWQKSEIVDLPRKPQESAQKQEPRKQQEPAPKQDPRKQQEANKQQDNAKAHHQAKNKKRKHPKKGKKP
jgi:hypothetical protein